jgi:hypothetical protein
VNEDELRAAFRTTMTRKTPPPMESAAALAAGHKAVRLRAAWAGAGLIGVLVVATSVGAAMGLHPQNQPMNVAALPSVAPQPSDTKPSWPLDGDGQPQEDATARSGAHYQQGVKLFKLVTHSVPAGWTLPTGKTESGLPLQEHQAQVDGKGWNYFASAAVTKDGRTGRLLAEVHTPGNPVPAGGPCALARTFWSMNGDCQVVTVGSAKVGVVVNPIGDNRIDQWAAYRYSDGTVVYTAQSRNAVNDQSNLKPLTTLPLTVQQLAALAVDPKFHVK